MGLYDIVRDRARGLSAMSHRHRWPVAAQLPGIMPAACGCWSCAGSRLALLHSHRNMGKQVRRELSRACSSLTGHLPAGQGGELRQQASRAASQQRKAAEPAGQSQAAAGGVSAAGPGCLAGARHCCRGKLCLWERDRMPQHSSSHCSAMGTCILRGLGRDRVLCKHNMLPLGESRPQSISQGDMVVLYSAAKVLMGQEAVIRYSTGARHCSAAVI